MKRILIVFDSNKLYVSQKANQLYNSFNVGGDYFKVKKIIEDKELSSLIKIAIPEMVTKELINQQTSHVEQDKIELKRLGNLFQLPVSDEIYKQDISMSLHETMKEFLSNESNVTTLLELKKDRYADVFQNIVNRSLNKMAPFIQTGNHSDYGFKDALIWETLLAYDSMNDYTDVFLFCRDKGFSTECITEFNHKYPQIEFKIIGSTEHLISHLEELSESIELEKDFEQYCRGDYFKSTIMEALSCEYEVVDSCKSLEMNSDDNVSVTVVLKDSDGSTFEHILTLDYQTKEIVLGDNE